MAGRWLGHKKLGCTAGHRSIVLWTRRASEPFSHIVLFFFFFLFIWQFMLKMRFIGLGKKFKLLNVNYIITKTQSCLYLKYLFDILP